MILSLLRVATPPYLSLLSLDLPELLKSHDGWWVAYHGDERISFARSQRKLYQECLRRGLTDDQFLVCGILPDAADDSAELLTPW